MAFNIPPRFNQFVQRVDQIRLRLTLRYDQLAWALFMLVVGTGLMATAWHALSLLSGIVLALLVLLCAWSAWNWHEMQISVAVLLLMTILILFSGYARILHDVVAILTLVLLWLGQLLLVLVEKVRSRFSYQHVKLIYWSSMTLCILLIIIRWLEKPALGLNYAGLPLASSLDTSALILVAMLMMFLLYLKREVKGNSNFLIIIPATLTGSYILWNITGSGSQLMTLPLAVLEHGLLFVHVPMMIIALALLIIGAGYAILILTDQMGGFLANRNRDVAETILLSLEAALIRSVKLALILLGFGILTGMLWSSMAWGHYWVWEVKQLLSVSLWFYLLAVMHLRLQKGVSSKVFAICCLVSMPLLLLTWFGTDSLLPGLHVFN
ncbi:MAG: cytochrome c biogenesis protein [Gammaproteobacteria bacterium]|nr:cytochrome c biogenesis protein [Gammaproteobacteria bacterium]